MQLEFVQGCLCLCWSTIRFMSINPLTCFFNRFEDQGCMTSWPCKHRVYKDLNLHGSKREMVAQILTSVQITIYLYALSHKGTWSPWRITAACHCRSGYWCWSNILGWTLIGFMAACIFIILVFGSAELTELLPSKCCFTASSAANLVEICLQTWDVHKSCDGIFCIVEFLAPE